LQAALGVESSRDILAALLAPGGEQIKALKEHDGWAKEARELLVASLGLQFKTRAKSWAPISE